MTKTMDRYSPLPAGEYRVYGQLAKASPAAWNLAYLSFDHERKTAHPLFGNAVHQTLYSSLTSVKANCYTPGMEVVEDTIIPTLALNPVAFAFRVAGLPLWKLRHLPLFVFHEAAGSCWIKTMQDRAHTLELANLPNQEIADTSLAMKALAKFM